MQTAGVGRQADAIGVFDSGSGGLSVLRELVRELPNERFVYLADSAYAPYGERDDKEVQERANAVAHFLRDHHHIKALVVACNTATAAAIADLRAEHADLPIVGIEPALKPAAAQTQTGKVGVMATRGTLGSRKFLALMQQIQTQAPPTIDFVVQACDGLADAIEKNDATKIGAYCAQYTGLMGQFGMQPGCIDTLVLGCTHYPFAGEIISTLVGKDITLLEGGAPVARQTRRILSAQNLLSVNAPIFSDDPLLKFGTTANPRLLQTALHRWLGLAAPVAIWKP